MTPSILIAEGVLDDMFKACLTEPTAYAVSIFPLGRSTGERFTDGCFNAP